MRDWIQIKPGVSYLVRWSFWCRKSRIIHYLIERNIRFWTSFSNAVNMDRTSLRMSIADGRIEGS